jgi:hypothetical protein
MDVSSMRRAHGGSCSGVAFAVGCAVLFAGHVAWGQQLDDAPAASDAGASASAGSDAGSDASAGDASVSSADGPRAISNASEGSSRPGTPANVTIGGYVEAFWQYNFNRPYNGETAARGFDTRHNTIALSNAVVDASWTVRERVSGRLALQFGLTPENYYSAEPVRTIGGTSGVGLGPQVWKFFQQAWVAYLAPVGRGLLIEGGLFLSPIGPEGMAVKDQWNWSRSNLFYGLPYYHTGVRVTYSPRPNMNVSLAGFNGWNSVIDNNEEKSLALQWTYAVPDRVSMSFVYFSGVERNFGELNGRGWRHTFDGWVQWTPRRWLGLMLHGNGGFEPVWADEERGARDWRGTQWWAAGAAYARVTALDWISLALRGDLLVESISDEPLGPGGVVDPSRRPQVIFFSSNRVAATRVASFTATLDARPFENISIRAEYRHDNADQPIYFDNSNLPQPGVRPELIGRTSTQNTLTLGMTAWY